MLSCIDLTHSITLQSWDIIASKYTHVGLWALISRSQICPNTY